jgi:Flp pilus assembly pilin Flp
VSKVLHQIRAVVRDEDGPTLVGYAVQPALILVVFRTAASWPDSNATNTCSYVGSKVKTTSS